MKLVDVHAHLEHSKFEGDLDSVIERFVEAGGEFVINSGTDPERNRETLALSKKYDVVKCSFGMYPIGDYDDVDGELAWIEEHADDCVAIGEIGLDYSDEVSSEGNRKQAIGNRRTKVLREKQEELFRKMLGLAKKLGKVVVVHSRKAEVEAIEILEEMGFGKQVASLPDRGEAPARPLRCQTEEGGKVVMHCFCGSRKLVERCVGNGWSFSVPPAIMRWDNFKMLVEEVPLGQLLTETDAPWLSPVVGERNEPVNVAVTIKEIARIKGVSVEEVAEQIYSNFVRLFR